MKIIHVVGARPNFMKAAPVYRSLGDYEGVCQTIVHTGQHYDVNMSDVFFRQLGLPAPDINLSVGSGSQARQTAEIMIRFEEVLLKQKPDLVLVYGDVNSTVAAALTCSKLLIRIGHVEAGLRSFDRAMPEEINRLVTDQLADLLFTPSLDGNQNLLREGAPAEKIHLVGNVMIDTLMRMLPTATKLTLDVPRRYGLVTFHRPTNVDDLEWLETMLRALADISQELPIMFPVHPRTRERIATSGLDSLVTSGVRLLEPLPYLEFLALETRAAVVITDSGGIQEETTFLGIPCITARENTERPITVSCGTNVLAGRDVHRIRAELERVLFGNWKRGAVPPLWDGKAAQRIAGVVTGVSGAHLNRRVL